MCLLVHDFDLQIHYANHAIANLHKSDGSKTPQKDHGWSVNFFTEKGKRKFWLMASTRRLQCRCTPVFEYIFFYTIDKMVLLVCPFLSDAFDQAIWQPQSAAELDKLMDAKVPVLVCTDVCISSFRTYAL